MTNADASAEELEEILFLQSSRIRFGGNKILSPPLAYHHSLSVLTKIV